MISRGNALEIPPTVEGDPKATEIARIWAAHSKQHVHLRSGLWPDAGHWGIMLADLARHVANAYEQDERGDYFEVLARIREIFDADWDSPTDIATGNLCRSHRVINPTSNQAMERTATSRAFTSSVTSAPLLRAGRSLSVAVVHLILVR